MNISFNIKVKINRKAIEVPPLTPHMLTIEHPLQSILHTCLYDICSWSHTKPHITQIHNILHIHNNVMWDWQYFMILFTHSTWKMKCYAEYCQSKRTLLWTWMMLCTCFRLRWDIKLGTYTLPQYCFIANSHMSKPAKKNLFLALNS